MGDTVPLIDAQTANILGSINKFTVQQHVKIFDNCIEQPNTYTIYNLDTQQALIRVQERSDCLPRICCAPHHSIILEFNALDPAGNEIFPVITMEREGCCSKPCTGGFVCVDCCAQEAYVHAGAIQNVEAHQAGKLPKDRVIGRMKQPVPFAGGLKPTIQVMDRTPTSDEHWASVVGPTLFGGCSENCCNVPFGVKRVNKDGSVSVDVGNIATITKLKPKSLTGAIREMLTDSDMFQFEIHDPSVTPQQRATLIGVLLLADYMFFERDIDQCGYDDGFYINLCNCYCMGALFPCQLKLQK